LTLSLSKENSEMVLEKWGINQLSREQQIIRIFEKVRDIPFGTCGSREPLDVYINNKGTCSGKNFLLRELFKAVGMETKDMICLQRWKDLTWFPDDEYSVVKLSEDLLEMLAKVEIVDFHNYVMIHPCDRWIRVDATIDLPLKKLGFHTVREWDGISDMPLCFVGTDKIWECGEDGSGKKAELTALLPKNIRKARQAFLEKLTEWIDAWRINVG